MLTANDANGNKIWANAGIRYADCYCPWCGEKLTHKMGKVKAHHFAHKSDSMCSYDKESKGEWHIHMQRLFPKESQEVRFYDNSTGTIKHIADVFLESSNTVIEFQHSTISEEDFRSRTVFHTSEGRRIVWIFDVRKKNLQDSYLRYSHLYIDMQHQVFTWKQSHAEVLSSVFGGVGEDQFRDVSICLYLGNEGDCVHRIISHEAGYKLVLFSIHNFNLSDIDANEFFYEELRWVNPQAWIERKRQEYGQNNKGTVKNRITRRPSGTVRL